MNAKTFSKQGKGQSAIEYLTTYGWMLLVIAVVGGTIFSTVQNNTELRVDSAGFEQGNIGFTEAAFTSNGFQIQLNNQDSENIKIEKITLNSEETGEKVTVKPSKDLSIGETATINTIGIANSSGKNEIRVDITYDTGKLDNLQTTGKITGAFTLNTQKAAPNQNWAFVDVSKVNQSTVDTSEMSDFYIMKYEASAASNISEPSTSATPVSREGHIPWTQISQNEAINVCQDAGYELPTNKQWQAATMAEIGNTSSQPLGNNNYTKAIEDGSKGTPSGYYNATLTGSGPESWSNSIDVKDLNGNVWEWTNTTFKSTSSPYYDFDNKDTEGNNLVGSWNSNSAAPESLNDSDKISFGNDKYWSDPNMEDGDTRVVARGGPWNVARAGVFSISVNRAPSYFERRFGFRCFLS